MQELDSYILQKGVFEDVVYPPYEPMDPKAREVAEQFWKARAPTRVRRTRSH